MKKIIYALAVFCIVAGRSVLQANIFKSSGTKQLEAVNATYPNAFAKGNFFKLKVDDKAWNTTLSDVGNYIKDAKANELSAQFLKLQSASYDLSNTNKILFNKYNGKLPAGQQTADQIAVFEKLTKPLFAVRDNLLTVLSNLAAIKKYDEPKKVLSRILELLSNTTQNAIEQVSQVTTDLKKQAEANKQPAFKSQGSLKRDADLIGSTITSAHTRAFAKDNIVRELAKADEATRQKELQIWASVFPAISAFLMYYKAPADISKDFEILKKANNAMVQYITTIVQHKKGLALSVNEFKALKENIDKQLPDIEGVLKHNDPSAVKDNKELRFELFRLALTLETTISKLKKSPEWLILG